MALMSNCQIHSYRCRGVGNLRRHPPPSILGFESVALTNVPWFMRTCKGGIRFSCNPFSLVYYLDCKYFAEINFWRISVKKSFFFVKIFTKYNHCNSLQNHMTYLVPRYYISLMHVTQNLISITSCHIHFKLLMILFSI